jgi:FMN phosphatase YigB (HAD superfamily)
MDFSHFTTITFDCYGTLIDWEGGILPALRAVFIPFPPSCVACTSRFPRGRRSRTLSAAFKNFSGTFAWL